LCLISVSFLVYLRFLSRVPFRTVSFWLSSPLSVLFVYPVCTVHIFLQSFQTVSDLYLYPLSAVLIFPPAHHVCLTSCPVRISGKKQNAFDVTDIMFHSHSTVCGAGPLKHWGYGFSSRSTRIIYLV